jgi:hypothetical protein
MYLVVLSGKSQGRVITIERDGVIGRDPAVTYPIDDPTVSRRHAEVLASADGWRLRDLGSANGTEINGARLIGDRLLREGDVVGLGRATLVYNQVLAATAGGPGPNQTMERTAMPPPKPLKDELAPAMMAALQRCSQDPGEQALALLEAIAKLVPGALRASLVDWRAGWAMGRYPREGDISRNALFRAMALLKSSPGGVVIWSPDEVRRLSAQIAAEAEPLIAIPVDEKVGLLIEGGASGETQLSLRVALEDFREATMLLRIPVSGVRAQAAAGSRKLRDADLRLAQRIQTRLLSKPPAELNGFELALSYTPALMIGGDFYHIEKRGADELVVVIGDVSGKGVSAALYMAYVVADLRLLIPNVPGPAELLIELQEALAPVLETGMFATVSAVYINLSTGICRVALAGHSPPVLRSAARKVIEMGLDPGSPLGAEATPNLREQRMQLAPGDCLLMTTDGVEEGENAQREQYGKKRRDQVLTSCESPAEINEALRKSLLEFVGKDRSTDDLTIICIGWPKT